MARLPNLSVFLGAPIVRPGFGRPAPASIAVWGCRPSAERGERYARVHDLPVQRVEDGFLRSLGLGCLGHPPLSLVVDSRGIYYDARKPSDLENLLQSGVFSDDLLRRAGEARDALLAAGLSKYNHAPDAASDLLPSCAQERVLVVDQTVGDMSVLLGGGGEKTFLRMLEAACDRFSAERVVVKTHPDVIAGKKQGYLTRAARRAGVHVLADDVAPVSLVRHFSAVYTVSSQMGMEALLLGRDVHCFGMPFYAGWGATHDDCSCSRRSTRRSVLEIFAAAYMLYARYVNPFSCQVTDIHDIIRILALQRRHNEANRGRTACAGYAWWKRPHARAFLQSTAGSTDFFGKAPDAVAHAADRGGRVVAWASRVPGSLEKQCRDAGVPLVRMEDGFLRSVGLGSDFNRPYSLVLDDVGVYYDPSRPSRLETILRETAFTADLLARGAALRRRIVDSGITKYNVGTSGRRLGVAGAHRIVLVPGQVEDDASVRLGGGSVRSNLELVQQVRRNCPDAAIVYKPHPDVLRRNRAGSVDPCKILDFADEIVSDIGMHSVLGMVHEVHTLTSLTGFEALLRGVPVHTYGGPFYAGWGLTTDYMQFERRGRCLELDALVAGTLIVYPAYYDWKTGMFCTPEDICLRLFAASGNARPLSPAVMLWWALREIWKSMPFMRI